MFSQLHILYFQVDLGINENCRYKNRDDKKKKKKSYRGPKLNVATYRGFSDKKEQQCVAWEKVIGTVNESRR